MAFFPIKFLTKLYARKKKKEKKKKEDNIIENDNKRVV